MPETAQYLDIDQVRIGHFIYVDVSWIRHPFSLNSFRIRTQDQLDTLRSLGLKRIRYSAEQSDPAVVAATAADAEDPSAMDTFIGIEPPTLTDVSDVVDDLQRNISAADAERAQKRALLNLQRSRLQVCERQFNDAANGYRITVQNAHAQPETARSAADGVVTALVDGLLSENETAIQLLSERTGDRASTHAINVTVLSLLLARACKLDDAALTLVGMGALVHDLGKSNLPDRVRCLDRFSSAAEEQIYQGHVGLSVTLAKRMGLDAATQLLISQHHERSDGSGYPLRLGNEKLLPATRIVALINQYDNLCNPNNPALAMTPHEALAHLYSRAKAHYDANVLGCFVRMMGVYPPGSVVRLSDGRHALVVSVNSSRPLKPWVLIHDEAVAPDEALFTNLEQHPGIGIQKSLKPTQLPKPAIDYLSPRQRVCYFFEPARSVDDLAPGARL